MTRENSPQRKKRWEKKPESEALAGQTRWFEAYAGIVDLLIDRDQPYIGSNCLVDKLTG